MIANKPHRTIALSSMIENLESRTLLCASVSSAALAASPAQHSAIHADVAKVNLNTHVSAVIPATTLGEAITISVTVKASAAAGAPAGTVDLLNKGSVIQTITLAPTTSANPKVAESQGQVQIPAGAGEPDYFFGSHHLTLKYTSSNSLHDSNGATALVVKMPKYTREADGLKIATVATGTGAGITAGQTATMIYTGYLLKNGSVFDYSAEHTSSTDPSGSFNFTVDASPEQVISGFDQGSLGMEVGETRVLSIPSKLGYGKSGAGSSIPPNANLVFLITLEAIS